MQVGIQNDGPVTITLDTASSVCIIYASVVTVLVKLEVEVCRSISPISRSSRSALFGGSPYRDIPRRTGDLLSRYSTMQCPSQLTDNCGIGRCIPYQVPYNSV